MNEEKRREDRDSLVGILGSAFYEISGASLDENDEEPDGVEVGDGT